MNSIVKRFGAHREDIKKNNDTTVARHLHRVHGDVPNKWQCISISVLHLIKTTSDSLEGRWDRDREERRWIARLKTLVPKGLNILD